MINSDDQNMLEVLAQGITSSPYLMMGLAVLALFFSGLLPFYMVPRRYILQRSPYFLLMSLIFSWSFYADKLFNFLDYLSIQALLMILCVQMFLAMTLSVMRARDAFGRGIFAIMLFIPILHFGLFVVSHEEGEKPYPKNHKELPLPRFCHGVCGVIIATAIWILPLFIGFAAALYFSRPGTW
ncbi:hypothetical protein N5853_13860 (plasmid) [Bartonella sp. HY329]|uniref:hypothetical protein n=1 Tax=unclassified Bartonella TaxID=2645622 RepID=UPI0021C7F9B7|nr:MULTISPECIES: hypothetical protein [unclassified Bartonella]UXM96614.1 hypothetical protein N5853_13860 [Bartonella sp. HY329]UXN10937.1 hypothetical protein N5852_13865 [Bartonella sp. HY328]